ncbi:hypothetical protein [Bradyrhizobium sp. 145]|uniref:hypothetical protein n=1 Tax=Bradyrhizobium sp. 145 TaxID=2782621 RepID=UPI001FF7124E|nr:hypothetical protein [Bradyrhizobium sp. 145]
MHSSLAVTVEGLPLGLAAVKFWTRKKFKGTAQLKKKVNPTRVPIEKKESVRWLDNLRQSIERLGQPERCMSWSRLSEQNLRVDKWSLCRVRLPSGLAVG